MDQNTADEKRAVRRFALSLPVTLTEASGEPVVKAAESRDVSSHGICFYTDKSIDKQSVIEFMVTLPTEVTMTEPINVRCRGTVVRVEGHEQGFAIAAAIDSYEFVSNGDTKDLAKTPDLSPGL
jgi:hypothetical protein